MNTVALDNELFAKSDPASVKIFLGLKSLQVTRTLLETPYMYGEIFKQLVKRCGQLPILPEAETAILHKILFMDLSDLTALSRLVTVLLNAKTALKMTRGSEFADMINFCGTNSVLDLLKSIPPRTPQIIPVLTSFEKDILVTYTDVIIGYLLGLFPTQYQPRFILRFPPDLLPAAIFLPPDSSDRTLLLEYCKATIPLLSLVEHSDDTSN